MWVAFAVQKLLTFFSAKNIRILYIESPKTVNEMTLHELVKLTTLWTTGPWLSEYIELHSNFSKTILHLLNGYCKPVLCDRNLESSRYSCWRYLILDRINNSRLSLFRSPNDSQIIRAIRTSTSDLQNVPRHQIYRTEEKINRTITFHKWFCNLTPKFRDIFKNISERGKFAP